MTAILDVDLPIQIHFDTPFAATINYSIDDQVRQLNVVSLSHMIVTPSSIQLDPTGGSSTTMLTVKKPTTTGTQSVLLRFTLGPSDFTAGTTAS
jgi:hypothetical protein